MKICRKTAGVILAVLLLTGCGSKDEEDVSVPPMQESGQAPEEEKAESEALTQEIPETPEKEALTNETPAELTDVEKYGINPISYDLSNLPPMENKLYAAWDGKIYFRQYSDEDMEEGGLWSEFDTIADTEKELMCMEPDGSIVQVGTDFGYGSMLIVDGRIYSQKFTGTEENTESIVYSCALDGSDVTEYAFSKGGVSGEVYAVKDGKVICKTAGSGLAYIDTKTGQEHILVDTNAYYLDATEEEVFYYGYQETDEKDEDEPTLYSVGYEGDISPLKTITCEEYIKYAGEDLFGMYPIDIPYFEILGDELFFAAGSYNGNAHMYSGGPIYSMKKDGSDCRVEAFSYDYCFYLYDDGESRAVYFSDSESNPHQCSAISLFGDVSQDIVIPKNVVAYDEPLIHNTTGSILFYPDTSGICYMLLTEEDCEELSIELYVDGSRVQKISDIEYLNGKLFFTVTDLTYSTEYSIGWRDGYERGRSICYCKDLESGNIRQLYEY